MKEHEQQRSERQKKPMKKKKKQIETKKKILKETCIALRHEHVTENCSSHYREYFFSIISNLNICYIHVWCICVCNTRQGEIHKGYYEMPVRLSHWTNPIDHIPVNYTANIVLPKPHPISCYIISKLSLITN